MSNILQVDRLKKTYGKGDSRTEALKGISFDVQDGEFLGIMGPSGSGKTTLLNCIATMIRPSSGKVILKGKDISAFREKELAAYRGKRIGYLFQEFELLDNLTIRENIELPLSLHGISEDEAESKIKEISDRLDIAETLDKFPSQVSGGQKQRAATDPEFAAEYEAKQREKQRKNNERQKQLRADLRRKAETDPAAAEKLAAERAKQVEATTRSRRKLNEAALTDPVAA